MTNNIFSSNHIQYQNTLMFNKVYGVDVQSPTVFRENWKLWNLHFRPKFQKYWIHQIAHIKYFIINDPTNDTSMMHWYKRKCEITVAYLRHRPSTSWKTVEKSGEILHWKKGRLSEYVTKFVKILFSKAIFKTLIEKWLIYHIQKEFNDFGLKITIFEISKIKIFEKNIFTGNCSCDLKISFVKIFLPSDIWISAGVLLKIKIHCCERGRTLNLFCRVYYW